MRASLIAIICWGSVSLPALAWRMPQALTKLVKPPVIKRVKITRVKIFQSKGRSMSTIDLDVRLFNPNPMLNVKASDILWNVSVPNTKLKSTGRLDKLAVDARKDFTVKTSITVPTDELPDNLIGSDKTIALAVTARMKARTKLGTIEFGANSIPPLQAEAAAPLENTAIGISGKLSTKHVSVEIGLPSVEQADRIMKAIKAGAVSLLPTLSLTKLVNRGVAAANESMNALTSTSNLVRGKEALTSSTPVDVRLSNPFNIPLKIVGGSLTVRHDKEVVGRASIRTMPEHQHFGYVVPSASSGQTCLIPLQLRSTHDDLPTVRNQAKALMVAEGRAKGEITLQGFCHVQPVDGASIGNIRTVSFNLTYDHGKK